MGNLKYTPEQIDQIATYLKEGNHDQAAIARLTGVTANAVLYYKKKLGIKTLKKQSEPKPTRTGAMEIEITELKKRIELLEHIYRTHNHDIYDGNRVTDYYVDHPISNYDEE